MTTRDIIIAVVYTIVGITCTLGVQRVQQQYNSALAAQYDQGVLDAQEASDEYWLEYIELQEKGH